MLFRACKTCPDFTCFLDVKDMHDMRKIYFSDEKHDIQGLRYKLNICIIKKSNDKQVMCHMHNLRVFENLAAAKNGKYGRPPPKKGGKYGRL